MEYKNIQEPWLSEIICGKKVYEGLLRKGFWSKLKKGDRFIAYSEKNEVTLEVTEVILFPDFCEAWNHLGDKLIPRKAITEKYVNDMYSEYYSDEDIKQYGVIAIGVTIVF